MIALVAARNRARHFFVAPGGAASGDGSFRAPWGLDRALAAPEILRPGATLWLRGGEYGGKFVSRLSGRPGQPLTVRPWRREQATINGSLTILGPWTIWRDLEIVDRNLNRRSSFPGSRPADVDTNSGVTVLGARTHFLNSVIHDVALGVGFWSPARDSLLESNLIYHCGWIGPDRRHGPGVYTQNETGVKVIRDNLFVNCFSNNFQVFGSPSSSLTGFDLSGNVSVNSRFLVGGLAPADRVRVHTNYTYRGNLQFGLTHRGNGRLDAQDNYVARGRLQVQFWRRVRLQRNRVIGRPGLRPVVLAWPREHEPYDWDSNRYHWDGGRPFDIDGEGFLDLEGWRARTGFDSSSQIEAEPSGTNVVVKPNANERGRGVVLVYNWEQRPAVSADLSGLGLSRGDRYEIRSASGYFERTMKRTFTGGPVEIPVVGWPEAAPLGMASPLHESTFPEFAAFLIRRADP